MGGAIKNILLIDDDQDDYFLFGEAIKKTTFSLAITHVPNFIEAMAYLFSRIPDLIFLDLNMPFKKGLDALLELKLNKSLQHIPVVIYSSSGYIRDIKTAYERGAALYFIKPSSFEELILSLTQIINKNWNDPKAITAGYLVDDVYVPFAAEPI